MRISLPPCSLILLLLLAAADVRVSARQAAPATGSGDASTEEATGWTPPPPSKAVEELQKGFANLYTSLRNQFGLHEREIAPVREFRQRVQQKLQDEPGSAYLLAMDLQLSMWLKDDERVQQDFRALVEATGDIDRFGEAWIGYVRGKGELDQLGEVYETLLARAPENETIRTSWADYLKQQGRHARAVEVLEQLEWDPAEDVAPAVTLAEAQMGLHRFEEAKATLESIPEETLAARGSLKPRVDLLKRQAEQYIELWNEEQQLRAAEAEADDLPRVAIDTSKGRIVLELFEDQAPNTVANFITLVEGGYYDGTVFHRRIPGTLIMGGDVPAEDGTASGASNPGYRIPDEHVRDDARKHFTGSLAMHKTGQRDTGGSIFYLSYKPLPERNARYTVFGRILEGDDVFTSLAKDDPIVTATVLRKRDQAYDVQTLPLPGDAAETATALPDAIEQPAATPSTQPPTGGGTEAGGGGEAGGEGGASQGTGSGEGEGNTEQGSGSGESGGGGGGGAGRH